MADPYAAPVQRRRHPGLGLRDGAAWTIGPPFHYGGSVRLPGKRNKHNVRTDARGKLERTYRGIVYASKAEVRYAAKLDLMKKAGKVSGWYRQPSFDLFVDEVRVGRYTPDFGVEEDASHIYYVEVKGRWTEASRLRFKLFRALYPNVDIRIEGTPFDRRRKKAL